MWNHDDDQGVGVLAAINQAGRNEFFMVGGAGSANAMREIKADKGVLKATVTYSPSMASSAISLARLIAQGKGMSRPGGEAGAGVDHAGLGDHHQGQRRPVHVARLRVLMAAVDVHTGRVGHPVPPLGVGMVGYAFMGVAHSRAWRSAGRVFDLPLDPRMTVLCGRDATAVTAAAARLGWASVETDWKTVLQRDDVALVDICTPGSSHAEIATAALAAGKHVLCEKPLANTVAEARSMAAAAREARALGVRSMVGFNYRRVPAVAFARALVAAGRIGTVRHVRAQYLQDWIVDPEFPLVWRLRADEAGSGALGDIGAHIVDLTQFVTGQRSDRGQRAAGDVRAPAAAARCRRRSVRDRGGRRAGRGHGRRRSAVPRPARRRRDRDVRGDPVERTARM